MTSLLSGEEGGEVEVEGRIGREKGEEEETGRREREEGAGRRWRETEIGWEMGDNIDSSHADPYL